MENFNTDHSSVRKKGAALFKMVSVRNVVKSKGAASQENGCDERLMAKKINYDNSSEFCAYS